MKTTIEWVGFIITLPFFTLEVMIKAIMYILFFPLLLCIAIIYPLIKKKKLNWVENWWIYANKWRGGFYSRFIYRLWKD